MNEEMKAFREGLRDTNEPKEKMYEWYNLRIIEDTIDGSIFICEIEQLGLVEEYVEKIGANNIEDGTQVVEYKIQAGPAGSSCFKAYTDKDCNKNKMLYQFADVWYKIYGRHVPIDRKFTKSELLEISKEIKEKLKDAKYTYIYSMKYEKSISKKSKLFEGSKHFGAYLEEDQKTAVFEMFDDDNIEIEASGINLKMTIKGKEVDMKDYVVFEERIESDEEPGIEISGIEIKKVEHTRIRNCCNGPNSAKFTKEACKQIVKDYEKKKTQEER